MPDDHDTSSQGTVSDVDEPDKSPAAPAAPSAAAPVPAAVAPAVPPVVAPARPSPTVVPVAASRPRASGSPPNAAAAHTNGTSPAVPAPARAPPPRLDADLAKENDRLRQENENLRHHVEGVKATMIHINRVQELLSEEKEAAERLRVEKFTIQRELDKLRAKSCRCAELTKELEEAQAEATKYKDAKTAADKKSKTQCDKLKKRNDELETTVRQQSEELERLRDASNPDAERALQRRLDVAQAEIQQLKRAARERPATPSPSDAQHVAELEREVQRLRKDLDARSRQLADASTHRTRALELQRELDATKRRMTEAEADVERYTLRLAEARSNTATSPSTAAADPKLVAQLKHEVTHLKQANALLKADLDRAKRTPSAAVSPLSVDSSAADDLRATVQQLRKDLVEREAEASRARTEARVQRDMVSELEGRFAGLQERHRTLQSGFDTMSSERDAFKMDVYRIKSEASELKLANADLQTKVERQETELRALRNAAGTDGSPEKDLEIASLKAQLQEKTAMVDILTKVVGRVSSENDQLRTGQLDRPLLSQPPRRDFPAASAPAHSSPVETAAPSPSLRDILGAGAASAATEPPPPQAPVVPMPQVPRPAVPAPLVPKPRSALPTANTRQSLASNKKKRGRMVDDSSSDDEPEPPRLTRSRAAAAATVARDATERAGTGALTRTQRAKRARLEADELDAAEPPTTALRKALGGSTSMSTAATAVGARRLVRPVSMSSTSTVSTSPGSSRQPSDRQLFSPSSSSTPSSAPTSPPPPRRTRTMTGAALPARVDTSRAVRSASISSNTLVSRQPVTRANSDRQPAASAASRSQSPIREAPPPVPYGPALAPVNLDVAPKTMPDILRFADSNPRALVKHIARVVDLVSAKPAEFVQTLRFALHPTGMDVQQHVEPAPTTLAFRVPGAQRMLRFNAALPPREQAFALTLALLAPHVDLVNLMAALARDSMPLFRLLLLHPTTTRAHVRTMLVDAIIMSRHVVPMVANLLVFRPAILGRPPFNDALHRAVVVAASVNVRRMALSAPLPGVVRDWLAEVQSAVPDSLLALLQEMVPALVTTEDDAEAAFALRKGVQLACTGLTSDGDKFAAVSGLLKHCQESGPQAALVDSIDYILQRCKKHWAPTTVDQEILRGLFADAFDPAVQTRLRSILALMKSAQPDFARLLAHNLPKGDENGITDV
ncbi:hypothetical protein AMAG_02289 [Allomyces macrogynus ATCC 38327]|uniref:Uncharacterized protein n=1 Tax=Allomyces macrogynus (strain ATCC 38327) TaxID=578462 RepID=A0A0L0S2B1_ALLM3|nr:hypothetical protein AMAG_02289 [Allomyces macrogynus ATCC 38327]|eukprot:KNE56489.1 hypothetical protein AMAG_02289 [Allomyces macrogynus ATCC 38327]